MESKAKTYVFSEEEFRNMGEFIREIVKDPANINAGILKVSANRKIRNSMAASILSNMIYIESFVICSQIEFHLKQNNFN